MKDETHATYLPPWFIRHFPKLANSWFDIPLWIHQVVKFGFVGGLNTAVDWGLYWLLTRTVPYFAESLVLAKSISYTVGIINSFFWNKNFTFRAKQTPPRKFILFFITNLMAVAINSTVMAFSLHTMQLSELASLGLATGCTLLWNFLTSKFLIFKQ